MFRDAHFDAFDLRQTMEIIFTKGSGRVDLMEVVRRGKPPERVDCPKQRIIPHDMVHFAAERMLEVQGFLRRVKDGGSASFGMQPEALSDSVERLVEVFQGDAWSGGNSSAPEIIDMYRVTCDARECPALAVDAASIEGVRETISELTQRWDAVPIGGSLKLAL
jgi:hypothetical protein